MDDLIIVRGVNIYPSSVEAIVRTFEVDEFRMVRTLHLGMEELVVEVEAREDVARPLADAFRQRLGVRIPTRAGFSRLLAPIRTQGQACD